MYIKATLAVVLAAGSIGLGRLGVLGFDGTPEVERVDFAAPRADAAHGFAAELVPASDAPVKAFRIPVTHETIEIAPGVTYDGWTFGGTVPGPTLRVREGDRVRITLVNQSPMPHSIDLHAARIPMNEAFRTIGPGEELSFEFEARDPGAFLVHCGTPPVLMHIMQGMYMAIIVDPKDGWGTRAGRSASMKATAYDSSSSTPDPACRATSTSSAPYSTASTPAATPTP